jgi:hypothetical protein
MTKIYEDHIELYAIEELESLQNPLLPKLIIK